MEQGRMTGAGKSHRGDHHFQRLLPRWVSCPLFLSLITSGKGWQRQGWQQEWTRMLLLLTWGLEWEERAALDLVFLLSSCFFLVFLASGCVLFFSQSLGYLGWCQSRRRGGWIWIWIWFSFTHEERGRKGYKKKEWRRKRQTRGERYVSVSFWWWCLTRWSDASPLSLLSLSTVEKEDHDYNVM